MALPAGTGLPSPKQVVVHTRAQNGMMTRRAGARNAPANRRKIASAAAGGGMPNAAATTPPPNPYQQQAQGMIDPIIAAITASAQQQAQAADKAIQGYTDSYAKGISGIDYGSPYSGAEAQQAAVDAALQQSATGQGSDLAAALSQRLQALQGSSGEGAVQQAANALSSQGAGIGGAQLATGSAALNQLIGDAAAAKDYGQKMPSVVRGAGLQGLEGVQSQAQQAINQGTLQAESQLPQIEQNLQANALQAKATKADAAYKNAEIGLRQQANAISGFRAKTSAQQGQARIAIAQQNANTSAARAAQSAWENSQRNKQAWARIGIQDARLQKQVMKNSAQAKMGGLTPSARSRYNAIADSWASRMEGTSTDPNTMVKDANGNLVPKTLPQLSFKDAMTQALKSGVPLTIAFPKFIQVAKANGATPAQLNQLRREYAPLDAALKQGITQAKATQKTGGIQYDANGLVANPASGVVPFG